MAAPVVRLQPGSLTIEPAGAVVVPAGASMTYRVRGDSDAIRQELIEFTVTLDEGTTTRVTSVFIR